MAPTGQMAQLPFFSMNRSDGRSLLPRVIAVAAGGLLGGSTRYLVTVATGDLAATASQRSAWSFFDWRLLVLNTFGVALAVWLVCGPLRRRSPDDPIRLFLTTGALGGLTTYSSLLYELGRMWQASPGAAVAAGALSLGSGALVASVAFRRVPRGSRAGL